MTRKFKALGLAFFAVLAMGAVMATSASATEFTAASYPVTYEGEQAASEPHVFTADGYTTTCKNVGFSGEASAASTEMTLTPVFSECTAFGLEAAIDMNGCKYRFILQPGGGILATVDLVCPPNKDTTVTGASGLCVVHVAPFVNKEHAKIVTTGNTFRYTLTIANLPTTLTDTGGFFCPFSGNTSVETATYSGNLTISGSSALSLSE